MATQLIKAEKRKILGRKVKGLRDEGILPANIYGKKVKSVAVQVDRGDFEKVFKQVGETGILEVKLGKEKRPVLIHNIQYHPVTDEPLHVDFHQIDLKQKVTASVPVELTGKSPAEDQALGTAVQYIDEIEVEALPVDLPEKFEVGISGLEEVDNAIQVKDLAFDKKKVEVKVKSDAIVVKVEPPREEEEELPPAEEVPVEGEEAVEEEAVPEEEKEKEKDKAEKEGKEKSKKEKTKKKS